MVIACKGIDILKRVLCLLLCVVLLFCFFMVPRAGAVALEATTIAYGGLLVGTILVGAGVVFSSHGDMVKVGNAMYKTLVNGSSAIGKTISSISAWAVEHGTSLAKGALRVGKDMYQAIVDAFNAAYSGGSFAVDSHSITLGDRSSDLDAAAQSALSDWNKSCFSVATFVGSEGTWKFVVTRTLVPSGNEYEFSLVSYLNGVRHSEVTKYSQVASVYAKIGPYSITYAHIGLAAWNTDGSLGDVSFVDWCERADGSVLTGVSSVPVSADLKYPSDDYLVRMPDIPSVDTATGDITYPNDTAYTKDAVAVPYPVDTEGVKVPDIPFDKPVDKSTGKTLDGTDTGTDTDNPSKPGEGTDTDNPNWPDTGSLSLPKLIASKFPFCIPFDVARLVGLLEAEPKAPVFRIPVVYANIVNEEIVIDFDKFADVLQIIRWGEIMLFVAGLVVITRNYIKW